MARRSDIMLTNYTLRHIKYNTNWEDMTECLLNSALNHFSKYSSPASSYAQHEEISVFEKNIKRPFAFWILAPAHYFILILEFILKIFINVG